MRVISLVLMMSLALLCAGCSDDDSSPMDPGENPDYPAATTPDQAMENFETAWAQMNYAEYTGLLATDFQFFFDPADDLDYIVGGPSWGLSTELATVDAMFSNQSGVDPVTDEVIPPIQSIQFDSFIPLDVEWEDPGSDEIYAGTLRQRYRVSMRVYLQGQELSVRVTGVNYFYAMPVEVDGETIYQIKIWEDRRSEPGTKVGSDETSWGELKVGWVDTSTEPVAPDPVVLATPNSEDIGETSVRLEWTRSTAPDFGYYEVFLEGSGGAQDQSLEKIYSSSVTTFTVLELSQATEYTFRVDVVSAPGLVGQGNSVTVTTDAPQSGFVPATTPDLAMQNFEMAWENLHFVEYSKLLHDVFRFFFDPADGLEAYVGGPSWGLQDELAAVQAMFSNQSGVNPITEEVIPPIESIQFTTFLPLDPTWQDPGSDELYAGTVRQRYQVAMRITYQGQELTTLVSGVNYFYVTPIQVGDQTLWQIKIWEDYGDEGGFSTYASLAGEQSSWGSVKAGW